MNRPLAPAFPILPPQPPSPRRRFVLTARRAFPFACGVVLSLFFSLDAGSAATVVLSPRWITLPTNASDTLFVDIDGDGRSDLLVMDPVEKKLLNYHQRLDGFSNSPDQTIALPPQTVWVAPYDVDPHPGLELLISTAAGLVFCRQNAGLFESEPRALLPASQVFTNFDFPILTSLTTKLSSRDGSNDFIPLFTPGHVVLHHRNSAYQWLPEPPMALVLDQTSWSLDLDPWRDPWTTGPNPARHLRVEQCFRAKPEPKPGSEPDNETIRKIIADMKQNTAGSPPKLDRVDVDGDGREDLVLWQLSGKLDFKTDLYIFLRGPDRQLPERPSQVLHCRGLPIPMGSTYNWSPVHDLDGNGTCELVLLEFKTSVTSASGLIETALSHGLDWSLTVRSFHHGAFSTSPDSSVPLTMVLPAEILSGWSIFIQGDFNGDGRPDFLVRRSETQWNIFSSTTDGRWFAPQPAMTFDAPPHGYIEIIDLNRDGLSDIVWHELDRPDLSIFMSPSHRANPKPP